MSEATFDLLIRNARSLNADLDGLDVLYVGITDGVVTYVGDTPPVGTAKTELWADGNVLLPGLVSAHTHVAQAFGKSIFDGLHLTEWLTTLRRSYSQLTDEQVYAASLLGALESLKSGVTFINGMATAGDRYDIVAQAIVDSGIKAQIGAAFLDRREGDSPVPQASTDQVLTHMQELYLRWHGAGQGRIRVAITPVGLPACSAALMRGSAELAQELNAFIHTHCSEEQDATAESYHRFGMSEVAALAEFGLLTDRTALAHCVWVSPADINILAETQVTVVHCPSTNMKITDGIAPIEAMRKAGVNLALGTDGAASAGSYDLLQEARLAAMLAKVATMDSQALPNSTILEMLSKNSQVGFQLSSPTSVGAPVVGAPADLTLIKYPALHLIDDARFLSNLVFSATASDVADVIVGGQILVRNHQLTRHDEAELMDRAKRAMASLAPLPITSMEEL